ncbi:S1 family peptidase [Xanthobacteraceae bacterium A53D]
MQLSVSLIRRRVAGTARRGALLPGVLLLCGAAFLAGTRPAQAIVAGRTGGDAAAAHTVMIVSTRGASCTGTAIAKDLLLTAAHCVGPQGDYAVALISPNAAPRLLPVLRIITHPRFDPDQFRSRKPTPDLALVKLADALPSYIRPATLANGSGLPERGTQFLIAGYGMAEDGNDGTAGTLRSVSLPSIGTTGGIMARLAPPTGRAGACTGDSGGPAFQGGRLAGVIGWATGPNGARGCGGVTGITLVGLNRDWIDSTAANLGSPVK